MNTKLIVVGAMVVAVWLVAGGAHSVTFWLLDAPSITGMAVADASKTVSETTAIMTLLFMGGVFMVFCGTLWPKTKNNFTKE
ncbi:hypothetical protein GF342_00650 [Candidatus Woesearchaeota archaeon]|nr:hypothetical protein [Candidatus Woesearchaeota archaeon]